jgi:hypothetical protein
LGWFLLGREKLVSRSLRLLGLGVASLREPAGEQLVPLLNWDNLAWDVGQRLSKAPGKNKHFGLGSTNRPSQNNSWAAGMFNQ